MYTTTRRKVRDEADADALLSAYAAWPDDFRSFCAAEGVDGRSLRAWQRRLTPEIPPPALQLVQLHAPAIRPTATYRLTVGDLTIELSDDFAEATLMRLIAVARAC